ncbi:dTDP-4-amino-4,6-dideoxy-D-galactose acyltransferase [Serratia odorifera]|jgi:dTDP-4-amino-4,6-dideoxy-D-galactose acyltransferase|uniref:dTDP-fucosamine acetyltransferase n=2 Tax=Serratia odorifera TaxID=618 RepID=D4E016_SEROD|nr:dTDP-4-amino-4,6-dideoxy-D-galactose acyltransferase [Serratia odorifera]EFE96922.1 TDP-D-fucosamine acetyltransferase [Serratia odorifera DSM 4582]MBJ2066316.1 dTDP-4-amino-4,6-dideoxy-D-galactose acyltransferase [Serratia odorifera]PNK91392.1 dTDP-4-amino-4,6-dideoxy-D-galactose acyltransferase [Serratia odorifera]RII72519.1 dTDP-4-amino-4,6-dideoxy-D-galactose acyltransferase [Serratia odorifera]VDZ55937.1 TDP-fucosamine acetyltransferase [Serratia odorifera]
MSVRASIEPLSWESDYFQRRSAKLHFDPAAPLLTSDALDAYALVQAKIPAARLDLADALAAYGFRLAEGEIDLALAIGTECASIQPPLLRVATPSDIPVLRAAAENVFTASRFRMPWYAAQDSGRFYATWIEKAVLGTFDHQCLLTLNEARQPTGFVSLRDIGEGQARIGLLAALPGTGGQGIGAQLMAAAIDWCRQRRIQRLWVATQISNVAALRLYQRHGALIESTAYWLYRGKHDPI